ncbi:hypothetical protein [Tahibacter amnicola]|uniref:Tetratricopeptide repeat protein n=1 Tax=Tahibacter amnicola TaxID=2976241 RepID=A0ABY6BBV4_9GAMM|nr:hypothetical protein [Tahibacter amnicola]UXI65800.1 hypothetical protein N4264_13605 [Tahibacter amnicola]
MVSPPSPRRPISVGRWAFELAVYPLHKGLILGLATLAATYMAPDVTQLFFTTAIMAMMGFHAMTATALGNYQWPSLRDMDTNNRAAWYGVGILAVLSLVVRGYYVTDWSWAWSRYVRWIDFGFDLTVLTVVTGMLLSLGLEGKLHRAINPWTWIKLLAGAPREYLKIVGVLVVLQLWTRVPLEALAKPALATWIRWFGVYYIAMAAFHAIGRVIHEHHETLGYRSGGSTDDEPSLVDYAASRAAVAATCLVAASDSDSDADDYEPSEPDKRRDDTPQRPSVKDTPRATAIPDVAADDPEARVLNHVAKLLAQGDTASARDSLWYFLSRNTASEATHRQYREILVARRETAELVRHTGLWIPQLLSRGRDKVALASLKEVLALKPDFYLDNPASTTRLARYAASRKEAALAEHLLARFPQQFPGHDDIPANLLLRAEVLSQQQERRDDARDLLLAFRRDYPLHVHTAKAEALLAGLGSA